MTCSMPWGHCGFEPCLDSMQDHPSSAFRRVMFFRGTHLLAPTNQLFCLDSTEVILNGCKAVPTTSSSVLRFPHRGYII